VRAMRRRGRVMSDKISREVIDQCCEEYEKRYRARTPPKEIQDVLPESRVFRSEIREWALQEGLINSHQVSELLVCQDFYVALGRCLDRLKIEGGES